MKIIIVDDAGGDPGIIVIGVMVDLEDLKMGTTDKLTNISGVFKQVEGLEDADRLNSLNKRIVLQLRKELGL